MANITGAQLRPIYERLNGAPSYHPLEADTFADWSLEAGDIVTVERDGNSYQSPVHQADILWKKSQQVMVSSTGKQSRDPVSKMSQRKYAGGSSALRNSQYQHIYVEDLYQQLRSGLELTTSTLTLYVDNRYAQMQSGLRLTASDAHLYVDNRYNQMKSGLNLTSSTVKLYVDDKYRQMSSGLELSTSTAKLYVDNKYSEMKSALYLTSSDAHLYVDNRYAQMKSGLNLTSSSLKLYVDDRYDQMKSGLNLTSSSAKLYVDNKYAQMTSGLQLTSSDAHLYVDNRYAQMKSGLNLTSSGLKLYVDDRYDQMKSGLNLTSSSAMLYTDNRTNRAYIMTRINANGEGEALIEADKVKISGDTTLSGSVTIDGNGQFVIKKATVIQGSLLLSTSNTSIQTPKLNVNIGGSIEMYTGSSMLFKGSSDYTLNNTTIGTMIKTFAVNNGTLRLTRFDNTYEDFSRAISSWSGGWSGNAVLTVKANPQNQSYQIGFGSSGGSHDVDLEITGDGAASVSSIAGAVDIPIKVSSLTPGYAPTSRYTKTLTASIASILQSKSVTSNGTVTPDSGYIGIKSITINVPSSSASASQINLGTPSFTQNPPAGTVTLTSIGNMIRQHRGEPGYVVFPATISGGTGTKYYAIAP